MDIVEIARVRDAARRRARFLDRVFSPDEIAYCRAKSDPWPHFAVRFAAKEAVWKALGNSGLSLKDISVGRDRAGKPIALVRGQKKMGISLSLSHSRDYALAAALAR
ncbi:MAG: holo-ACP synthase [Elusimicrobiota bacterium]